MPPHLCSLTSAAADSAPNCGLCGRPFDGEARSASAAGQDAEEGIDVLVGAYVAITVEVG
jgi:hypothetical protein